MGRVDEATRKVGFVCWRCSHEWFAHMPKDFSDVQCLRCMSTSLISIDNPDNDEHITVIDNEADAIYAKEHLERWMVLDDAEEMIDRISEITSMGK